MYGRIYLHVVAFVILMYILLFVNTYYLQNTCRVPACLSSDVMSLQGYKVSTSLSCQETFEALPRVATFLICKVKLKTFRVPFISMRLLCLIKSGIWLEVWTASMNKSTTRFPTFRHSEFYFHYKEWLPIFTNWNWDQKYKSQNQ